MMKFEDLYIGRRFKYKNKFFVIVSYYYQIGKECLVVEAVRFNTNKRIRWVHKIYEDEFSLCEPLLDSIKNNAMEKI